MNSLAVILSLGLIMATSCERTKTTAEDEVVDELVSLPPPQKIPLAEVFTKHRLKELADYCETKGQQADVISDDVYAATLCISRVADGFKGGHVKFFGTDEDLRNLSAELKFIRLASDDNGYEKSLMFGKQVYKGALESTLSQAEATYKMLMQSSLGPLGSLIDMDSLMKGDIKESLNVPNNLKRDKDQIVGMVQLLKSCDWNLEVAKLAIKQAFELYWEATREKTANDNGITQAHIWFPEVTYPLLDTATEARMGGRLLPDVLLIAVTKKAGATKLKPSGVAMDAADDLIMRVDARFENSIAKAVEQSEAKAVKGVKTRCEDLRSLVDPAKLQTLKAGTRAANSRFRQLCAHAYDLKFKTGRSYEEIIEAVYEDLPKESGRYANHIYAPATEKRNLVAQLRLGERYGLDDAENIARMRSGKAPIISKGEHAGKVAHVDHILPVAKVPALENSMANLRWLSADQNLSKGASMTPAAMRRMKDLEDEVGWTMPQS